MKYRLIISDFDGTLGYGKDIEQETVDTIKTFIDKGGKFVICTGRHFDHIKNICNHYGLTGLVATLQGSAIFDIKSEKCILMGGIDYLKAKEVIEKTLKEGLSPTLYIGDTLYYQIQSEYVDFYKNANTVKSQKVDSLIDLLDSKKCLVQKIVIFADFDKVHAYIDKYNKEFDGKVRFNTSGGHLIEVIDPAFNKGEAVRFVAKYYNIPLSKVMAVGDSLNDLEMIDGEWHGVAVGNACKELKDKAKETTVDFCERPIKHLIEKYCL